MIESLISAAIAVVTGGVVLTSRLHTRIMELDKRIDNAYNALEWCYYSKSEWGVNYWKMVINALVRKLNRNEVN